MSRDRSIRDSAAAAASWIRWIRRLLLVFAGIVLFVLPLVIRYAIVTTPEELNFIYGKPTQLIDIFNYHKAIWFQYAALALFACSIVYYLVSRRLFRDWANFVERWKTVGVRSILGSFWFWSLLFACSILMAYLASDTKTIAWTGAIDRYEGTLTWLTYILFGLSVYMLTETEGERNMLFGAFLASASIVAIIGLFQMLRMDLFMTDFGKRLIFGRDAALFSKSMSFQFGANTAYSTLYNPNYFGFYLSVAVSLSLYLALNARCIVMKALLLLSAALFVTVSIGTQSSSGQFAIVLILMLYIFQYLFRLNRKAAVAILLLLVGCGIGGMLLGGWGGKLQKGFAGLLPGETKLITSIKVRGNAMELSGIDGSVLELEAGYDEVGNFAVHSRELSSGTGKAVRYAVQYEDKTGTIVLKARQDENPAEAVISFHYILPDSFSFYYQPLPEGELPQTNMELFANAAFTGRGYIWNNTLGIVRRRLGLGYGADTYVTVFPHLNLVQRQYANLASKFVDKPHNMGLLLLTNFGFAGTLAFAGLFVSSLVAAIKRGKEDSVSLLIFFVGFILASLTNDSVIYVTAPLFLVLGSVNRRTPSRKTLN